jgi:exodeoxyribonuclease-3
LKYILRLSALFIILFFHTSFKPAKNFIVIAYNVWNGFESEIQRKNTFVKWARKQNADVIAFEELNNFTQDSFSKLAKTWGHSYAVIVKEDGYPVGISSRYPITNVYKLIAGMHHGCLYAEIKGISFFIVHFSPFSSAKRLQESHAVIKTLKEKDKLKKRTIILGDFNAFSPNDSSFYAGTGIKDSMYLAQQKNSVLQNLNEKNEIDYQVIRTFLQAGFYDNFAQFNKTFEASYPSRVYFSVPLSEKIRIDHMLLSKSMKVSCKKIELIKDAVTDTLSDHYPIKATFRIQ